MTETDRERIEALKVQLGDEGCLRDDGPCSEQADTFGGWCLPCQAGWLIQQLELASSVSGETIFVQHARKQGAADGFQQGWHAALSRVTAGDSVEALIALVPVSGETAGGNMVEVVDALRDWINAAPLPPSQLHPVYNGHVLLCELIRQALARKERT